MSAIRTDRPRNAALNKERSRIDYAKRRLHELLKKGHTHAEAWEVIQTELKDGKS